MNPGLSALLLLLPCLALALLMALLALREWRAPQDAAPLAIDSSYSRNDKFFAEHFRRLSEPGWQASDPLEHGPVTLPAGTLQEQVLLVESLRSGPQATLKQEAWARSYLSLGPRSRARALVCDGRILLGQDCVIEDWLHGDGEVVLDDHAQVAGRITSERQITLGAGCRSRLISAPSIQWRGPHRPVDLEIPSHAGNRLWRRRIPETGPDCELYRRENRAGDTVFRSGNLILGSDEGIDYSLVVRGDLYIRRGAVIAGDIKAHGDLTVEGCDVVGNLCCGGRLRVGAGSTVQGSLRGDVLVWLGDGVQIGRPGQPQAVVGDRVLLAGSGRVHGRIRALAGWIEVEA